MTLIMNSKIEGSGKAVLLLHGLFGSKDSLMSLSRDLKNHYQVHRLDLRNHGDSPHGDLMDYPSMARDLCDYCLTHQLSSVFLIGHSMGGKVAMQTALLFPELVSKLVVVDIAPVRYPENHTGILEGMARISKSKITSRQEADAMLKPYEPDYFVRQFILKNLKKSKAGYFEWKINLQSIVKNYPAILDAPRKSKAFTKEVLFVAGQNSDYIQEKYQRETISLFPKAKARVIAGASHYLHVEKKEVFNRLCMRYLRDE